MIQSPPAPTPEPVLRVDGPEKVSGTAHYPADVRLSGLLYGVSLRGAVPHALITSIDTSAARQIPGVRAVLTAQDLPTDLIGKTLFDMPLLARDRVRYLGEQIAVVAADSREIAEAAVAAIKVTYQDLPVVSTIEETLQPGAVVLHPDRAQYKHAGHDYPAFPEQPNVNAFDVANKGDVDEAFKRAAHVSEDVFSLPMQHVGFLEPHACTVAIQPDGKVHVWCPIKIPFSVPTFLSRATGLPAEQFVIMPIRIGGDFGGKGYLMDEALAYFLERETGHPIQMVMRMNDEFIAGVPRHGALIRIKSGVDADGKIIARECEATWDSGAYAAFRAGTNMSGARRSPGGYSIPNLRVISRCVWTNHLPCGSMRAPGHPQVTFACESHTDLLARRLNIDPIDFRRRNLLHKGDEVIGGDVIDSDIAPVVLERAIASIDWTTPLPPGHGRGLSFSERGTSGGPATVEVSVDANGSIVARTGVPEQGAGAHTIVQQVVARTLGVPASFVRVVQGDTDTGPYDQGAGGSHVTNATGGAALSAATRLRDRLRELAAESQGWQEDTVEFTGGTLTSQGESINFTDIAARLARQEGGAIAESVAYRAEKGTAGFACYVAEVAVDQDTGQVRLEKLLAVHDVGYVIYPNGVLGQIHGGLIQALGQAVSEELNVVDGRPQAINFGEYKMFSAADLPELRIELIEERDGPGPYGSKGVGEISALAPTSAIANAIDNAVGVRIKHLPITSEKVLAALNARKP